MGAVISPCGTWRYSLSRDLAEQGIVAAIFGVNPSTADATANDQTIRKDIGFGQRLGWRRLLKGNVCAYRATDVRELARAADPVGPDNLFHVEQMMREADQCIFAWGPLAKLPRRLRTKWRAVWHMAVDLGIQPLCFGTARDGHPLHTLMLPYSTELRPWSPAL